MLIELNYVFLSILLVVYGAWRYFKRKEKHLLHLTLSFTFLTLSAIVQMFTSPRLIYVLAYVIPINVTVLRLLELVGLALFACFIISAIIALREISTKTSSS